MKQVTRYETYDGKLHDNDRVATKHLDEQYGDIVTKMAHQMVYLVRCTEYVDFIGNNIGNFRQMLKILDDLKIINPEEE